MLYNPRDSGIGYPQPEKTTALVVRPIQDPREIESAPENSPVRTTIAPIIEEIALDKRTNVVIACLYHARVPTLMTRVGHRGIIQLAAVVVFPCIIVIRHTDAHAAAGLGIGSIHEDRAVQVFVAVVAEDGTLAAGVREASILLELAETFVKTTIGDDAVSAGLAVIALELSIGELDNCTLRPGPGDVLGSPLALAWLAAADQVAFLSGDDEFAGCEADSDTRADSVPGPSLGGECLCEIFRLGPGLALVLTVGEEEVAAAFPGVVDGLCRGSVMQGETGLRVTAVIPAHPEIDRAILVDDGGRVAPCPVAGANDLAQTLPVVDGLAHAVSGLGALVDEVDVAKVAVVETAALGEGDEAAGLAADDGRNTEGVEADSCRQLVGAVHVGAAEERELIVRLGLVCGWVVDLGEGRRGQEGEELQEAHLDDAERDEGDCRVGGQ